MPAQPLSPEQQEDARRLKQAFRVWQVQRRAEGVESSQEWAADQLGFGQSALSQYLNGKIPLNADAASKLAQLFGIPVRDFSPSIADGIEAMLGRVVVVAEGAPAGSGSQKRRADTVTIHQFDTGGAMGGGFVLKEQPGVIQSWEVSQEWAHKNLPYYTTVENLGIVTGFGDSMLGMFNPGDPILVDRGITKCDVDGVYFFRVDGEGFIKRLQRIPGEGILVISENSKYRDWTIKPSMDFQVLAKVLTVWRSEHF
ncbi:LexA family transcriptional regulator [Paracidovorax citrulli]|uniref:LexA family transcriptional regulator n=1 Tax=Paracidovorax citrulli TaxID=80869 RepID=UPI003A8090A4